MEDNSKIIGLLGGMAWPSTQDYYSILNKEVEKRSGLNHSARCIIYSYDFDAINPTYRTTDEITAQLNEGITRLLAASASLLLLCSNTTHKYLDGIKTNYPPHLFLDIRDCVGMYLQKHNIKNCLLLGTKFTMREGFYANYISSKYPVTITAPEEIEQGIVHSIIFEELINDTVSDKSLKLLKSIISSSKADAVLLACTELRIAFAKISTEKLIVDTTEIHAVSAINYILK